MNDWQMNVWYHVTHYCPNFAIGVFVGFALCVPIAWLVAEDLLAKENRLHKQAVNASAKGSAGETCVVCQHTRAEGFRFFYPFNVSVCSNCVCDDLYVAERISDRLSRHHCNCVVHHFASKVEVDNLRSEVRDMDFKQPRQQP